MCVFQIKYAKKTLLSLYVVSLNLIFSLVFLILLHAYSSDVFSALHSAHVLIYSFNSLIVCLIIPASVSFILSSVTFVSFYLLFYFEGWFPFTPCIQLTFS